MPIERIVRLTAWVAFAAVVLMIAIFAFAGVGQDPLQFVHPSAEYQALLLANPSALRACIGLDDLFIVAYSTLFVALGITLRREGAPPALTYVAGGLLLALGLLDMIENFHFLTMLARAEQGIAPSDGEIGFQVQESLFKFHVSYLGMLLLGLSFTRTTRAGRWLRNLSVYVQAPIGLLIYVVPRALAVPLVFGRFSYFLAALVLSAVAYGGGGSSRSG